jgi:hypothetical protein
MKHFSVINVAGRITDNAKIKNMKGADYFSFPLVFESFKKDGENWVKSSFTYDVMIHSKISKLENLVAGKTAFVSGKLQPTEVETSTTGTRVYLNIFANEVIIIEEQKPEYKEKQDAPKPEPMKEVTPASISYEMPENKPTPQTDDMPNDLPF